MTLDDETGSETQDGVDRRMDRRDALRKAAAGAAVAGVAWSAPSVKGLTLVPDYASAGTVTGLTRTFRILGVERNFSALNSGNDTHDFRGLNTPEVAASGGSAGPRPRPPPRGYTPATAQVSDFGPVVTMSATLDVAGSVSATMSNSATAYFRADAGSTSPGTNSWYTAPDRIRIPVTFDVDPPFNQCKVSSGTLYSSNYSAGAPDFHDLGSIWATPTGGYPTPLPLSYTPSPRVTVTSATLGPDPGTTPGTPFMNITPAPTPNTSGTFTQTVSVENRDNSDNSLNVNRILEIRFVVTC